MQVSQSAKYDKVYKKMHKTRVKNLVQYWSAHITHYTESYMNQYRV